MRIAVPKILLAALLVVPTSSIAAGLPPWQFGMDKEQVKSFRQFGPYKSFKNGDLETYKGLFHGHKENVQFFFENNRLYRIGVYLWEGKDAKQGIPAWKGAYELLEKDYGKIATPNMHVSRNSGPVPRDVIAYADAANADLTGRTTILPAEQPRDMRVSAQFMRVFSREGKTFAIAIFLDPRKR